MNLTDNERGLLDRAIIVGGHLKLSEDEKELANTLEQKGLGTIRFNGVISINDKGIQESRFNLLQICNHPNLGDAEVCPDCGDILIKIFRDNDDPL